LYIAASALLSKSSSRNSSLESLKTIPMLLESLVGPNEPF